MVVVEREGGMVDVTVTIHFLGAMDWEEVSMVAVVVVTAVKTARVVHPLNLVEVVMVTVAVVMEVEGGETVPRVEVVEVVKEMETVGVWWWKVKDHQKNHQ